jgi:CubicO group peptidase (beta-lactamase class C family)
MSVRNLLMLSAALFSGLICPSLRGQQAGRPAAMKADDGWETADVKSEGFDPAKIEDLIERIKAGDYKNIHSMLLVKNGKLVFEAYFPGREEDGALREYGRDVRHGIHSATKSINSLLIGIAIGKKLIPSVDVPAATFFPQYSDVFRDTGKQGVTLKHLLSMTAGLAWNEESVPYSDSRNDHVAMNAIADPVRYVLERPLVDRPGSKFNYSSGISIVLGEIVHKASGLRADEFAKRYLFEPLNITDYEWLKYPGGVVQTGGGLAMRPRDMAKIGQLVLNGGRWGDTQLISEQWIRESMKQHAPDRQYGYQWWLGKLAAGERAVITYGAQGRGGQFILVMPELKLVAVFTGWNDGNGLGEQPFEMLRRFVIPAIK